MYVQVGFSIHLKCKIFAKTSQLSKEIVEMYRGQLNIVLSVELNNISTHRNEYNLYMCLYNCFIQV